MRKRATDGMVGLGRRVRAARRARGMNQRDLAAKAGISRDSLVKLERGQRETRPSTLDKVAKALGMGFGELVEADVFHRPGEAVGGAPPGYVTIRVAGASLRDVLDAATEAYERSRARRRRVDELRAGVMDAGTALDAAGGRRKPRGVPRERAVELPPGEGLSDAVLEERAARGAGG